MILCCDPSIRGYGYVTLDESFNILESGAIRTVKMSKKLRIREGDDRVRRIGEINDILIGIIKSYPIDFICAELPHGSQSAVSAMSLGLVTALTHTLAQAYNIPIEWYSEGDAKKALIGKRTATKNEVIEAVDRLYQVPWTNTGYKNEAIADSLAIFNVAKKNSPLLKLILKQHNKIKNSNIPKKVSSSEMRRTR